MDTVKYQRKDAGVGQLAIVHSNSHVLNHRQQTASTQWKPKGLLKVASMLFLIIRREIIHNILSVLRVAGHICLITILSLSEARAETATLAVADCLQAAAENNRELLRARDRLEEVKGDRLVVRSRFFPHLNLIVAHDASNFAMGPGDDTKDRTSGRIDFAQRLFEFGPDAAKDIQLRSDLREALFGYEGKVHEVLARVWEVFHLILLQERQIALRRESRDSFRSVLERQVARFEKRLASEEDKLNAELNVLNEELAINRLVRQRFNNEMELLRLIGRPIGGEVRIGGRLVPFAMDQDEAVQVALQRDVQVALRHELVEEQQRVVGELDWEYSPDVSLDAGVEDGRKKAGISVDRENKTWGVDATSEFDLSERESVSEASEDAQWSAQIEARFPIFDGGSRPGKTVKEKAKLRQLTAELRDQRAGVELKVRQAYQSMLEAEEQQRIQEQQVVIARRRLEINQLLKEKGKADEAKLEQVRDQFFDAQDALFGNQATYISRQANLRRFMGYVE